MRGCQVKSIHGLVALRRATTTPPGIRATRGLTLIKPSPTAGASHPWLSRHGIEPGRRGERIEQGTPLGLARPRWPHQQITILIDVASRDFLRHEAREIALHQNADAFLLLPATPSNHRHRCTCADTHHT